MTEQVLEIEVDLVVLELQKREARVQGFPVPELRKKEHARSHHQLSSSRGEEAVYQACQLRQPRVLGMGTSRTARRQRRNQ